MLKAQLKAIRDSSYRAEDQIKKNFNINQLISSCDENLRRIASDCIQNITSNEASEILLLILQAFYTANKEYLGAYLTSNLAILEFWMQLLKHLLDTDFPFATETLKKLKLIASNIAYTLFLLYANADI